ncbi:retinoblastoma-binding protein 5 homolog isoform X2 [Haemaphysalis longicornis]
MNLELLESFGQNYPQEFDGTLDCISLAVTCAFNKQGTLLAVGYNDGRLVIWDFLTRGIAKVITAHVHPVCSLCFSRNGHKLLSASTDNSVCIWDVVSGDYDQKYRFPSPILKVQFHPRNDKAFLVCPLKHTAVLVNVEGVNSTVPLDNESDLNIVASFDRRGDHIYTGNAKGKVLVVSVPDFAMKASFRVTTGTSNTTAIKSIEFARRGDLFLVNTADRIIRVYNASEVISFSRDGEPKPLQKLQDLVNKTTWKKCCFSGDGEYICAGSAREHALYIWEKSIGNLVKILHGTKGELLLDVVWHPVRPIIASISSGVVSLWAQQQVENWSAFAPDFKELDENVEYEERESEFDLEDEDASPPRHMEEEQDGEVDVETVEPIAAFCSRFLGSSLRSGPALPRGTCQKRRSPRLMTLNSRMLRLVNCTPCSAPRGRARASSHASHARSPANLKGLQEPNHQGPPSFPSPKISTGATSRAPTQQPDLQ